jgi:hypothetical protein
MVLRRAATMRFPNLIKRALIFASFSTIDLATGAAAVIWW